ncbi:discoidin domain-containing protein [Saccharothrix sp. AJ9571]|nr:discoidin domain-containing protein [Saccharothrix sp. AJ9571]
MATRLGETAGGRGQPPEERISGERSGQARRLGTVAAVCLVVAGVVGVVEAGAAAGPRLDVAGVAAGDDDGNVAGNTLDGDLTTRWSAEGEGVWISYDLGSARTVGSVSLAWHKGDTRKSTFDVELSGDGTSWSTVAAGRASTGTTNSPESHDFPDSTARYVRIVGHGNTVNDWTSITETAIFGADGGTGPGTDQTQAAVRHNWGTPRPISDEFDYTGPVDPAKWATPSGTIGGTAGCWEGHAGNGRRCAKNSTVANGLLTLRGEANGDTGWLRQKHDAQYGKWEIRSRSRNTGPSGGLYHPLHLIWPTAGNRLENGEYDWVEYSNPDAQCLTAFLHYPKSPSDKKERRDLCPLDMTQWHNFAFEWTPEALVGYVDGEEWFRLADGANADRGDIQAMPSGHLNIQLDNFTGAGGLRPAVFEVDWVRLYA